MGRRKDDEGKGGEDKDGIAEAYIGRPTERRHKEKVAFGKANVS